MSETVHILCEDGVTVIPMVTPLHEAIADRLAKGYLKRVNADGTPYQGAADDAERVQPAPYASKKEWVGWAVHVSSTTDNPISPDDAEALTKNDLIERFGVK